MDNKNASMCGWLDTKTGEFKTDVSSKNGTIVYKNPLPWWKRLFGMKSVVGVWGPWETIASATGQHKIISASLFSSKTNQYVVPYSAIVQKRSNNFTDSREYRVSDGEGGWLTIDPVIFEQERKVVESNIE